jgi:chromosome segregation ATPase
MLNNLRARKPEEAAEQLLKLYSNRANVKRELNDLRKERHDLLDKLKEQEGEIFRAQEQLEGLERLLTNPLAAANAMVYFQLRHLWRVGAQKVQQFGSELKLQREQRERAQLQDAALAKRNRRLTAIKEKLERVLDKQQGIRGEIADTERDLESMNKLLLFFKGPALRRKISGLNDGDAALQEKVEELNELQEKIQGEVLPEPDGLSLESRRLINCAVIALAQHLVVHFADNDLRPDRSGEDIYGEAGRRHEVRRQARLRPDG